MGVFAPKPAAEKISRPRSAIVSSPGEHDSTRRAEDGTPTPDRSVPVVVPGGMSPMQLMHLQGAAGNGAVRGFIQRQRRESTAQRPRVSLDLGWLDFSGNGVQTNE